MNEEHFTIDKSTPVVYAFKFKSGLDRGDSHLVQFVFQFVAVLGQALQKKYPVSNPSIPYLGNELSISLLYHLR